MTVDGLGPYLSFLAAHRHAVVFLAAAIDSTGLPFPGRVILVIAGAVATSVVDATWMILLAAAGALIGDHSLYVLGWLGGDRVLRLYCRWTLGSARCIRKAQDYFRRFGGATIVIGRFVAGVRIFAAALAGSGGIAYRQFLLFDVLGSLFWATVCILPGYLLGPRATRILEQFGDVVLLVGLVLALGGAGVIAFRVWKRRRHTPAKITRARAA